MTKTPKTLNVVNAAIISTLYVVFRGRLIALKNNAKGKRRGFSRPLDPLVMRFLEVTHETLSKHVDR